jgi:putative hydrolase of the HAD superfamily
MAMKKLKLLPEQCVFVGDHPVNDVEGADRSAIRKRRTIV